MAKPNVQMRTREVGWWHGTTNGSLVNNNANGQNHGTSAALAAGATAQVFPFQVAHAIMGGAGVFSRGFTYPTTLEPTRDIIQVFNTHCLYVEVSAHLRSAGNVDLPGVLRFYYNDLWPTAAAVANPSRTDLGDWNTGAWQEWEDWSPLTVPTPPPGFTGGGAAGIRYEFRQLLGRVPANFMFATITNAGSVAASEWGVGLFFRNQPGV